MYGTLGGEKIRRALDLTSWEAASELVRGWESSGQLGVVKADVPTVKEAVQHFLHDLEHGQHRKPTTLSKHTNLLVKRLLPWCEEKGVSTPEATGRRRAAGIPSGWPDAPVTAQKKPGTTAGVLLVLPQRRVGQDESRPWPSRHPSLETRPSGVKTFDEAQLARLLGACAQYPRRNSYGHDNPARVRAFVLTLRYSGLRIGDCVGLRKEHLDDDCLFLRTKRPGSRSMCPSHEWS